MDDGERQRRLEEAFSGFLGPFGGGEGLARHASTRPTPAPLLWFGIAAITFVFATSDAQATQDVPSHRYKAIGFSKDGRYAYFIKDFEGGAAECVERWLAVYRTDTRRHVAGFPLLRRGQDCAQGRREISAKAGKRTAAKVYRKYGALVPGVVYRSTKNGRRLIAPRGKGELRLVVRGRFPKLIAEPLVDSKRRARLHLTITWHPRRGKAAKGKPSVLYDRRLRLAPVASSAGSHAMEWPRVALENGRRSPKGEVLALVVLGKPLLLCSGPCLGTSVEVR